MIDWLDLLAIQGTLKSRLQHQSAGDDTDGWAHLPVLIQ